MHKAGRVLAQSAMVGRLREPISNQPAAVIATLNEAQNDLQNLVQKDDEGEKVIRQCTFPSSALPYKHFGRGTVPDRGGRSRGRTKENYS
jgi:hypothetical protein